MKILPSCTLLLAASQVEGQDFYVMHHTLFSHYSVNVKTKLKGCYILASNQSVSENSEEKLSCLIFGHFNTGQMICKHQNHLPNNV